MVAAGIAAGAIAAGAAYVNGKWHIGRDLRALKRFANVSKTLKKRAQAGNASLFYDFEEQALQRPAECGIWYRQSLHHSAVEYTLSQVYDNSLRYAALLLDLGLAPGDLVASYLMNSPEFIFKTLGCWAIGCAPAEINYNLADASLLHCLKISGSRVLIADADSECLARIEAVRSRIEGELGMRIIVLDEPTTGRISNYPVTRPADALRAKVAATDPAFIFYTSGTTGMPKACSFRIDRAYMIGIPIVTAGGIQPGDRWYDCMPLYHGTGGTTAIGCMLSGVTLCLGRKFSTSNFWQDIHDSGAHAFVYVGETARYLLAAPPSSLDQDHNLKVMFGNGLRPDVWTRFQSRFNVPQVSEFFNSSEGMFTLMNTCRGPFHRGHVGHHGGLIRLMTRNVFVPVEIDHEEASKIWRDPSTGFAKRNSYEEGGEILVACENKDAFAGYHNNSQATNSKFEVDVFKKGDLWYRTGDALRRDADGRWYFLDRLGDTFRWRSENVSTAEVAQVLGDFPGVVEANVYGAQVPNHEGRAGCAAIYVQPGERAAFDWRALHAHARKQLPRYAVPVFIRIVKSPTPMHNNKQNKIPLRNEGVDLSKIAAGTAGPEDELLWLKPNTETYEPFRASDHAQLVAGKARL